MEKRAATIEDLETIMYLIEQAKDYLKSKGIDQWQDGYPDVDIIREDIQDGNGYVLIHCNEVIGYICISFDGEERYDTIDGQWKSIQPYAVVHRMAIDNNHKGRGLTSFILKYVEELCHERGVKSIKIDTDDDNTTMKHILAKNKYEYCGIISFDNSDKIAFEKLL